MFKHKAATDFDTSHFFRFKTNRSVRHAQPSTAQYRRRTQPKKKNNMVKHSIITPFEGERKREKETEERKRSQKARNKRGKQRRKEIPASTAQECLTPPRDCQGCVDYVRTRKSDASLAPKWKIHDKSWQYYKDVCNILQHSAKQDTWAELSGKRERNTEPRYWS